MQVVVTEIQCLGYTRSRVLVPETASGRLLVRTTIEISESHRYVLDFYPNVANVALFPAAILDASV